MQDKSVARSPLSRPYHPSHPHSLTPHSLEIMPLLSLKSALAQQIQLMNVQERFVLTKVHAPQLIGSIRNALRHLPRSQQPLQHKEENTRETTEGERSNYYYKGQGYGHLISGTRTLCDSIVFVSDGRQYLDHISLQYSMLQNCKRLIDLLTSNVQDPQSLLMIEALKAQHSCANIAFQLKQCRSREQLDDHLTTFLRVQILLRIRNSLADSKLYSRKLQEEKRIKKQFNKYWHYLPEEHKRRILLLDCKDIEGLTYHLSSKYNGIFCQMLEQEQGLLLKLNRNQFSNRIFKCKIRHVLQPLVDYHRHIYLLWKKQLECMRRKRVPIKPSRQERDYNSQQHRQNVQEVKRGRGKKRKTISLQSNETNETQRQLKEKSFKSPQKQMKELGQQQKLESYHYQLLEVSSDEDRKEIVCSIEREERSLKYRNRHGKIQVKQERDKWNQSPRHMEREREYEKNPETIEEYELMKQYSVSSQTTFSSEKQFSGQSVHPPSSAIRLATLTKLDAQLSQLSDLVSEQANQYYERRIVAFERIQFLLQYYSIPIKLFGSCANGIAVKNSDIDIAIDQSILQWMQLIPESQKVRVALQKLQQILQPHPCITEIKLIKTAAIPVMKLTIDTSLEFINPQFFQLNRQHNCGPIQADITIQTPSRNNQSSHLGIRTTSAISQWLSQLKPLHTIVITLKEFFTVSKLNLAYEGGLNTISMIVMLVAYIKHAQLQDEDNCALVLERFLTFYAHQFDETKYGIDLLQTEGRSIFYRKEDYGVVDAPNLMKAELQIRDPICQGKNMTRNSYLYPQIKQMFKKMLEGCFKRGHQQCEEVLLKQGGFNLPQVLQSLYADRNLFLELHKQMETNI